VKQDTFWSDTLTVCLSDEFESSVEGPYHVVEAIAAHLRSLGLAITRIEESQKGTININPRREAFIKIGASDKTLKDIELFLESKGVHLTKHETAVESNYLEFSYELENISRWSKDT
jgi:hypothetical protein